ncbi:hypothetical protein BJX65DRAFT_101150 [Aspergillus insuetus]
MPRFLWITPRPCLRRVYNSCGCVYIVLLSPALLSSRGFSVVGVDVESLCRCRPSVNVGLLCYTSGLPWCCVQCEWVHASLGGHMIPCQSEWVSVALVVMSMD